MSLPACTGTNKVLGGVGTSVGVGPAARALGGIEGSIHSVLPARNHQASPEVVHGVRQLVEEDVLRVVRVASVTDIDTNVYVCLEVVLREVRVASVTDIDKNVYTLRLFRRCPSSLW